MQCFLCKVGKGNLTLLEHEAARWLSYDELDSVDWLPADRVVVQILMEHLLKIGNRFFRAFYHQLNLFWRIYNLSATKIFLKMATRRAIVRKYSAM